MTAKIDAAAALTLAQRFVADIDDQRWRTYRLVTPHHIGPARAFAVEVRDGSQFIDTIYVDDQGRRAWSGTTPDWSAKY